MGFYGAGRHAARLWEGCRRPGRLHTLVLCLGSSPGALTAAEVSDLCDTAGPLRELVLAGRDPFERPDLYRVARMFLLRAGVERLAVLSDGSLPRQAAEFARDLCAAHPLTAVTVKVRLDGLGGAHDELRGRAGAFDRAVEALAALRREKARHGNLCVVVSSEVRSATAGGLRSLMDFVYDQVVPDGHEFELGMGRAGRPDAPPPPDKLAQVQVAVLELKRRYMARDGMGRLQAAAALGLAAAAQDLQRRRLAGTGHGVPCSAGRNICLVDESGGARPCPYLPVFGDLRAEGMDFGRVWRSAGRAAAAAGAAAGCPFCTDALFLKAAASSGVGPALRLLARLPAALLTPRSGSRAPSP